MRNIFLDINLDLTTGKHKPYRKPNNPPMYINAKSNHPPSIIRNIPPGIGKRISNLSSSLEVFEQASDIYNDTLEQCGYEEKIKYHPDNNSTSNRSKRKRRRKIIWFNPPYSKNVKSNVGKTFFRLIDKHFPLGGKLNKIFNKKGMKVSYSCMRNMSSVMSSHNSRIMRNSNQNLPQKECNCKAKNSCPLNGKCLSENIIYKASVISDNACMFYVGLSGGKFKYRLGNHKKSFKHEKYEKDTALSKYVWSLKRKNIEYSINWEILYKSNISTRRSGNCNLCLQEKLSILQAKKSNPSTCLNKRSELVSKCRHGYKPPDRGKKK